MAENVKIQVRMTQLLEGETDVTENITEGLRSDVNNKIFLTFEEMFEEINEPISTRVKIEEEEMSVTRTGGLRTKMEFIPGKTTRCNYNTPAGLMIIDIETNQYTLIENDKELQVNVKYKMYINETFVSDNTLEVKSRNN